MTDPTFLLQSATPFSESLIWQLNRDYYQQTGLEAWRNKTVPHNLTSNSMVGRTYAELIFAFLKDLAAKGQTQDKVYVLELGAGHGRLAFHVLKHLERLVKQPGLNLPEYCYVLTDIIEDSLGFFLQHPQFQAYFAKGQLDVAYLDAIEGQEVALRFSKKNIVANSLKQPLVVLANYFFDSIPNDLFHIKDQQIAVCSIALETEDDPEEMDPETLLKQLQLTFIDTALSEPFYEEPVFNKILTAYTDLLSEAYLFFPNAGLQCLERLRKLSKQGLMVLSMDKGFHEIHDLDKSKEPELIKHGSYSIWVNYHAFGRYCDLQGGKAVFPALSTFYLELACLFLLPDSASYTETEAAYQRVVNDFGPDDFNGLKRLTYQHMGQMSLLELIAMLRLSGYDSGLFQNVLPRLQQVARQITVNERTRLAQTLHQTWALYFSLNEPFDLAYEIGGLFYDLAYYREALDYFQHSIGLFGPTADVMYNQALCYYQLREDELFQRTLAAGKASFPTYERFAHLDKLDLGVK